MSQLPNECLSEIFEYLKEDQILHSCLLVNRLWYSISVRILWRNIINYDILIACLPDETKTILSENGINISTSAAPVFNYLSFCKVLSTGDIVNYFLENYSDGNNFNLQIVVREVFKFLMNQINSLDKLDICFPYQEHFSKLSFPGAEDRLNDLTELHVDSDLDTRIFVNYLKYVIIHNQSQ